MKLFISVYLMFTCLLVNGQDSLHSQQETTIKLLRIKFPGEVTFLDTANIMVYSSVRDSTVFQIMYTKKIIRPRNGSNLLEIYDGFIKGYVNSPMLSSHTKIVTDTSIGGTSGKYIVCTSKENIYTYRNSHSYTTLANDHFYTISIFSNSSITDKQEFKNYFASIRFLSKHIRENDLALYNKGFEFGQQLPGKIGYFLGYASIPFLIGIVIYILVRKRTANKRV